MCHKHQSAGPNFALKSQSKQICKNKTPTDISRASFWYPTSTHIQATRCLVSHSHRAEAPVEPPRVLSTTMPRRTSLRPSSKSRLDYRRGSFLAGSLATRHTDRATHHHDRIPLNDDAGERAKRSHGRKALHEAQINQLKAAAVGTPGRKVNIALKDLENVDSPGSNPRTPRARLSGKENSMMDDDDGFVVGGSAVTPMKRVPLLANFEEWMKMATDNKINATNSWNFALIDYFHDMSLLKEGNGVNFQKASCTLDGCVKIYTSRVDSVATETGKLLSGLADSRDSKKKNRDGEDGEEDDEEEVDENGNVKKKPKKKVGDAPVAYNCRLDAPSLTAALLVPTIIRVHLGTLLRLSAAEEAGVGIRRRPAVQEGIGRF